MERIDSVSKIDEYVRKFGSASRFVQKIVDSLDCPFAIVDVKTYEIEVTNSEDFFPGMKCGALFKCFDGVCDEGECPIGKVVKSKKLLVVENDNSDFLLEIHIHPIFDVKGDVVSVIIYGFDVAQSQALKDSEEKFKRLSESSPMGIFYTDAVGGVLYTNPTWQKITGLTFEESLGFKWTSALHPEDKSSVLEDWKICLEQKVGYDGEFRFVDTLGEVKWVHTTASPLKSVSGEFVGFVGTNENITERKKAEKEIENLAKFPSENKSPVIRLSNKGILLYANLAALSILESWKWEIGKLAPKQIRKIVKFDSELGDKYVEEISCGDKVFMFDVIHVLDSDYINLYGRDITERRGAEKALKKKEEIHVKDVEERFYNILQNSQDLVYRYDFRADSFDYVSESVFTILGYSLGEFMKMNRDDYNKMIHPDDAKIVGDVGDVSEEESVSIVKYRFKRKDGDYIWLKVQRIFFRDKNGVLIYSIEDVRDVTLEKLADDERVKLEERISYMKNKATEMKERVSLTDREKLVLWGFCRYSSLNDEELAKKLDLKRSTLTAIKNRLKGKGWFSLKYIPNFNKLGCQFFSVFGMNFKYGKTGGMELVKDEKGVVLSNYQDDKLLGGFVSDKYVDFKRFLGELAEIGVSKYGFHEDSFFYNLDDVELYDVSGLINSLFGLKRKEKAVVYRFENGMEELNTNEKRVMDAMIKNPEMSSSDVAKKIWTSKPTVIKVKKKLLDEGFIYPYVVPDLRKMGFSYIAWLSFSFDSDSPVDTVKGFNESGVILKVKGKDKMMKIVLFVSEEEYEEEVDLIKELYRKNGIGFKLNSEIFPIQKRRSGNPKMEMFINDKLFGDEL